MAVATFDTLKFANTLKAAGVPDKQAEAQATAFAEIIQANFKELVTKADLEHAVADLRREIGTVKSEVSRELGEVRTDLSRELGEVRTDLSRELGEVRTDLSRELGEVRTEFSREVVNLRFDLSRDIKEANHQLTAKMETWIAKVHGELALLRWITGVATLGVIGVLVRLFLFRGL